MRLTYLDDELKKKLVDHFEREVARANVDEQWVSHVIEVMKLDGVASSECCVGHRRFTGALYRGYVSLIFSREKQKIFDGFMKELLSTYPVMTIRKMYTKGLKDELGYVSESVYCINEICFEMYSFQSFLRDCFNPLLEKLA